MALDHCSPELKQRLDPAFRSVLQRCIQQGWRYRVCLGGLEMPSRDELKDPALSIAARWLWEHGKHLPLFRRLSLSGIEVTFRHLWDYLQRHRLRISCADVLAHVCGPVAGAPVASRVWPMVLINLDEVNALFPVRSGFHAAAAAAATAAAGCSELAASPETAYISECLRALLQLQVSGLAFVYPVLTATKALEVRKVIQLSGCSFQSIALPLLSPAHVVEMIRDLEQRAASAVLAPDTASSPSTNKRRRTARSQGSEADSSVAAAASAAATTSSPAGTLPSVPAYAPLPPLLCHLLQLMAGHPRFLEALLLALGRPDGPVDEFRPAIFSQRMREFLAADRSQLDTWLRTVADAISRRYSSFESYLLEPRFASVVPELLGFTLFEWPITRQHSFTSTSADGQPTYVCLVREMEEDGVVFLAPRGQQESPDSMLDTAQGVHAAAAAADGARGRRRGSAAATAASSALAASSGRASPPVSGSLRLVLPFIWLRLLFLRYSLDYRSSAMQLPLLQDLTCCQSPVQNEQLTISVLALKCYCWAKQGKTQLGAHELLLDRAAQAGEIAVDVLLPPLSSTSWPVVPLTEQVTAAKWAMWLLGQSRPSGSNGFATSTPRFFLNARSAPFWDSCVLSKPAIFVQDKQRLGSRERAVQGKRPQPVQWAEVEEELTKCGLAQSNGKTSDKKSRAKKQAASVSSLPLFLYCTDSLLVGAPNPLPAGVLVADARNQAELFGSTLAARKAMCLSELTLSNPTSAPTPQPHSPASSAQSAAAAVPTQHSQHVLSPAHVQHRQGNKRKKQ